MQQEMTRELIVASLNHCASGSRCTECPCGGAPTCKDIYRNAARIINEDEAVKKKQKSIIESLEGKVSEITKSKSESIHQMWNSMIQVQQVYSNRCKDLEHELEEAKRR